MLSITVPGVELYDEKLKEFTTVGDVDLELEHSLVSLSKWESVYKKPFLGNKEMSTEEVYGYIQAMTLDPKISPEVFFRLTKENLEAINQYIEDKMTATWFNDHPTTRPSTEVITSELIYYWMISFNIPIQCESWHLGRLLTLIRIFQIKNSKPTKMSRSEMADRRRTANAQRKAQLGTRG
jgi:hypothetical protein